MQKILESISEIERISNEKEFNISYASVRSDDGKWL